MPPFSKISGQKKSNWQVEYVLRRDLGITGEELANMSYVKVKYFLKLLEDERKELEKEFKK
jgi:hypothetical protein